MQKYKIATAATIAALSFISVAPAFAEGQGPQNGPGGLIQRLFGRVENHVERRGPAMEIMSGKVSSVSSPDFTFAFPTRQGTTTVTVVTTASTTFMLGTTTASFADVTSGALVSVSGPYATSTQTLTASRVQIVSGAPRLGQMVRGVARDMADEHMNNGATSTPREDRQQFETQIVNQFSASTSPDVVRGIIQAVFGGLRNLFRF